MKKSSVITCFSILIVILTLIISCSKDKTTKKDFSITAPSDWTYAWFTFTGGAGYLYIATSPLTSQTDSFYEDFRVLREEIPGYDLNSYSAALINSVDTLENFNLVSTVDTSINGEPSVKFIFTATVPAYDQNGIKISLDIEYLRYAFFRNNFGYLISCSALPVTFKTYYPIYQQMVSTFKFNP